MVFGGDDSQLPAGAGNGSCAGRLNRAQSSRFGSLWAVGETSGYRSGGLYAAVGEQKHMIWASLATCLSLLVYVALTVNVGKARAKYHIAAPAITGDPAFERIFRVHQNTMESLVAQLPALWLFDLYGSDRWAGVLGMIWVVGRVVYAAGYYADASKRSIGAMICMLTTAILLIGALIEILMKLW
jgi:uncharacterized membrane protein YecN with MAPEG domain